MSAYLASESADHLPLVEGLEARLETRRSLRVADTKICAFFEKLEAQSALLKAVRMRLNLCKPDAAGVKHYDLLNACERVATMRTRLVSMKEEVTLVQKLHEARVLTDISAL